MLGATARNPVQAVWKRFQKLGLVRKRTNSAFCREFQAGQTRKVPHISHSNANLGVEREFPHSLCGAGFIPADGGGKSGPAGAGG